ncbi:putative thiol methyltransferase [Talaromyces proteolyticus]|uniref:Thiol methyltransferase n=1 Tax=Talaromyces proteolyticus TaxID=1131652 RepID=A0AAD4L292_9EURO|nr:putative thiol methyltransferase [Talaromyces proteolyticus]KAH8701894.1 putative thiol methyltransferase [Talaromyces proteolyticus]
MAGPPSNTLRDHMAKFQGENYVEGWASLWDNRAEGERLGWDRGGHSPALEDFLIQKKGFVGSPIIEGSDGQKSRKKALVPGCGTGYDVLLLASFGYDAYGLDYSEAAVETANKEAAKNRDEYGTKDPAVGQGNVVFVQGDFFKDDWLTKLELEQNSFDLIYDYTFFCALQPYLRPKWALRHRQLLAPPPTGNLICLEWPTTRDPSLGGPPFGVSSWAYMSHLSHPGEEIPYHANGDVKFDPLREVSPLGLERVIHWKPERTHKAGKDEKTGEITERISLWRRQN